jgi:hypothetical protein
MRSVNLRSATDSLGWFSGRSLIMAFEWAFVDASRVMNISVVN